MDCIFATAILSHMWSAKSRLCPSLFFIFINVLRSHFHEYYHILWRNVLDGTILMQRELSTFPLASNCLHKLSIAGYSTVDDLKDVSPTELSEGKYSLLIFSLLPCLGHV